GEAALGDGGDVRNERRALERGDGDGLELASLDVRQDAGEGGEDVGDLAADDVGDRRAGAAVGDVAELDAGERFEIRGGEVSRRAHAAGAVGAVGLDGE